MSRSLENRLRFPVLSAVIVLQHLRLDGVGGRVKDSVARVSSTKHNKSLFPDLRTES